MSNTGQSENTHYTCSGCGKTTELSELHEKEFSHLGDDPNEYIVEKLFLCRKCVPHPNRDDSDLIEKLAKLEHRQWMYWAQNLMEREDLPDELTERWKDCMVPYDELGRVEKDQDRRWARRAYSLAVKSEINSE